MNFQIKPTFLHIITYIITPIILLISTFATYYPSLFYDFQFDDIANIKKFFALRTHTFWNFAFKGSRWISYWLNTVNYSLGKFNPFYYRLGNVFFHIITGLLIFFVTIKILQQTKKDSLYFINALPIATITAILFLLHPVQTQTVSYVIQGQLEGLAGLFIMAIVLSFVFMTTTKNKILFYILNLLIFLLGYISCGTKEIAILSPCMLLLIDWFFIAHGDFKKIKKRIPFYLIFTSILIAQYIYVLKPYFFKNYLIGKMELNNNVGNVITNAAGEKITRWSYFISQFKVIVHYLWIFIWPWNISVDYDWKMVSSFFCTETLLPLAFLLLVAFLIMRQFKKNSTNPLLFGLMWFFIGLSPRSSFIPSTELVADYKTYFSSFGLFLFFALLITIFFTWITKKLSFTKKQSFILSCICLIGGSLFLSHATYTRNKVWRSQEEFWIDIIKNSPKKARGYNNYAVALAENGHFEKAIPYFRKAIKMDPYYPDPWSNIAVCFNAINQVDMAITQLEKAIKINPYYPEFYNNLASFYLTKKNYPQVEILIAHALKLRPHYGKAYFNLGQCLYEQGKKEDAFEKIKTACIKADFDTLECFTVYAQLALELQKFDDAVVGYEHIYALAPHNPDNHFNLANAYYCTKQYEKAKEVYTNLIAQNTQEYRSWFNLAETYLELGNTQEAIKCFKMAQPLETSSPHIAKRIAQFTKQNIT